MTLPPPTERQARIIWLALTGLAVAALCGLVALFVWGVGRVVTILAPVLWPLAVAGVLAYLLDPVVDLFERKGAPRTRAIVLVFSLALVIVALFFGSIVPQIVVQTRQLLAQVPHYVVAVQQRVGSWVSRPPPWLVKVLESRSEAPHKASAPANENQRDASTNLTTSAATTNAPSLLSSALDTEKLQTAAGWVAQALSRAGAWLFGRVASWFGLLTGAALVPVYCFYFLMEKRGISSRWSDYLPVSDSTFKQELVFVLSSINNYLITFFRGQVLVGISDGILYGIGFFIIGLPYALVIGAAASVLTIVPFLGAIIVCLSALIMALVQYGDWLHPLEVLLVFAVVQSLEGLVISPRILGGRVGLHPVTIIIAVMAGTTLLGGLLGGILAIPLTAALRVIMFRYIWKRPATHDRSADLQSA
jgi:predicted PurR-regulated permease PerM